MLPLSYFSDRRFSVGSAVITTSFFVMFGFFFLFSLYLQFARGYSPLEAGLATLPFAVGVRDRVAPQRDDRRAHRQRPDDRLRLRRRRSRHGADGPHRRRHALPRARRRDGAALVRHGGRGGAGDGRDHERRADGQGRRRLGGQRHTRELGGALGIAVFGSIANSAYRANIDLGGLGLSTSEVAEAEESIGAAAATAPAASAATAAPGSSSGRPTAFTDAVNLAVDHLGASSS